MSMFERTFKKTMPKTINDCIKSDEVGKNLWDWAAVLEKLGILLCIIIIIWGIVSAFSQANQAVVNYSSNYKTNTTNEFNGMVFLTTIVTYFIYAFIEYCIFHSIALLIGAFGGIYENTKQTAKLLELKLRKSENDFTEIKVAPPAIKKDFSNDIQSKSSGVLSHLLDDEDDDGSIDEEDDNDSALDYEDEDEDEDSSLQAHVKIQKYRLFRKR